MTVDEFCKWIERLEHPLYDIPRALKKEKRYAFFNLAFGDFPGRAVGLDVIEATDASHFDFMQEKGRMNFLTVFCLSW